jgi:hypothetical protein
MLLSYRKIVYRNVCPTLCVVTFCSYLQFFAKSKLHIWALTRKKLQVGAVSGCLPTQRLISGQASADNFCWSVSRIQKPDYCFFSFFCVIAMRFEKTPVLIAPTSCRRFCKLIWRQKKLHTFKKKRPNVFAKCVLAYTQLNGFRSTVMVVMIIELLW